MLALEALENRGCGGSGNPLDCAHKGNREQKQMVLKNHKGAKRKRRLRGASIWSGSRLISFLQTLLFLLAFRFVLKRHLCKMPSQAPCLKQHPSCHLPSARCQNASFIVIIQAPGGLPMKVYGDCLWNVVCQSQLPGGGDVPAMQGHVGEPPGPVRRQRERGTRARASAVVSMARNREGRISRLGMGWLEYKPCRHNHFDVYSSVASNTFTVLYNQGLHPPPELFIFPNGSSAFIKHEFPSPLPPAPGHHRSAFCL